MWLLALPLLGMGHARGCRFTAFMSFFGMALTIYYVRLVRQALLVATFTQRNGGWQ
jgi:hypothetical protein